jgi:hypothetical protein
MVPLFRSRWEMSKLGVSDFHVFAYYVEGDVEGVILVTVQNEVARLSGEGMEWVETVGVWGGSDNDLVPPWEGAALVDGGIG